MKTPDVKYAMLSLKLYILHYAYFPYARTLVWSTDLACRIAKSVSYNPKTLIFKLFYHITINCKLDQLELHCNATKTMSLLTKTESKTFLVTDSKAKIMKWK